MPLTSRHCVVRNGPVVCVTDLAGQIERVVCPELIARSGMCRARSQEAHEAPLSNLLTRVNSHDLALRGDGCLLRPRH
jgi:hypothetical protein